jgi:hypothetical protein
MSRVRASPDGGTALQALKLSSLRSKCKNYEVVCACRICWKIQLAAEQRPRLLSSKTLLNKTKKSGLPKRERQAHFMIFEATKELI